jgi:putative membrane protein
MAFPDRVPHDNRHGGRPCVLGGVVKRILATVALGLIGVGLVLGGSPAQAAPGDEDAPKPFVLPENIDTANFNDGDKVFLEKVKQAGLWEIPMGELAEKKGLSERTRTVGRLIADDHVVLNDDVKRVAERFGHPLPSEATLEQQGWMAEITAANGKKFDELFAQRLRFAHGVVYGAIAQVRAFSRNALMREFAKQCELFVHRHMSLLESTNEVDMDAMPPAVVGKGNNRSQDFQNQPLMMIAFFAVTGAIGVAGVVRGLRGTV